MFMLKLAFFYAEEYSSETILASQQANNWSLGDPYFQKIISTKY